MDEQRESFSFYGKGKMKKFTFEPYFQGQKYISTVILPDGTREMICKEMEDNSIFVNMHLQDEFWDAIEEYGFFRPKSASSKSESIETIRSISAKTFFEYSGVRDITEVYKDPLS